MDTPTKRAAADPIASDSHAGTPDVPVHAPYKPGVVDRALDRVIAWLEPVMPDMSDLGAVMLIFMLLMALTGGLTPDDDVIAAQQAAEEAAAATPNYVPF